jgi:hypothetical protein
VTENTTVEVGGYFLIKRDETVSGRRPGRYAQAICTELLTDFVDKTGEQASRRAALFSGMSGLILARPLGAPL